MRVVGRQEWLLHLDGLLLLRRRHSCLLVLALSEMDDLLRLHMNDTGVGGLHHHVLAQRLAAWEALAQLTYVRLSAGREVDVLWLGVGVLHLHLRWRYTLAL